MTSFKPAPEGDLSSHIEDDAPIPRHEFTEANQLHSFTFDTPYPADIRCPDCDAICNPDNLGEAVDWALGHKCADDGTATAGKE